MKPAAERSLPEVKVGIPGGKKLSLLEAAEVLADLVLPLHSIVLRQQDRARTSLVAARVMLALRLYHDDHGGLPDALANLVPAYLDEVPADPFDGKPLRYSREKKIVYSVGDDFADAGGSAEEGLEAARTDQSEPTFRVEIE